MINNKEELLAAKRQLTNLGEFIEMRRIMLLGEQKTEEEIEKALANQTSDYQELKHQVSAYESKEESKKP